MTDADAAIPAYCLYQNVSSAEPVPLEFDRHYLAYAAEGVMHLITDERRWSLQPTSAAWIPAGTRVVATIPTSIVCCSLLFDTRHVASLADGVQVIELSALAREMVLHCEKWTRDTANFSEADHRFLAALLDTVRDCLSAANTDWIPTGRSSAVQQAIATTQQLAPSNVSLAMIAESVHMSDRTLTRKLLDETGMSWSQLLRRARILAARERLSTSHDPITDIAAAVGYASQSAFNRAFREDTGRTPGEFRRSRLR